MARIDDLIEQVGDDKLRAQLIAAAAELRKRKRFGLVYEEHIPETVLLASDAGVKAGATVMIRTEPNSGIRWIVEKVSRGKAHLIDGSTSRKETVGDLLVVKPFGEPAYPVLRRAEELILRAPEKPFHTVINGENFHALQVLLFSYEGKVDCIYIDPPYNTGARDWKYSNDYVDGSDTWRHSKWLSFMEKRLRLARRLLKPDGVLVVTIDEHEVNNLGVLLRQLFSEARVQMVTIVTNTAGSTSPGLFSRAEEYAFFCFFGAAKPAPMETDLLADSKPTTQFWFPLFRSRGLNDRPSRRPNLVYPIAIDPQSLTICGTGRSLKERVEAGEVSGDLDAWLPDPSEDLDGKAVVWPILHTGEMSTWQVGSTALPKLVEEGFVRVRAPKSPGGPRPFTIAYVKAGNRKKVKAGQVAVLGREPGGALILEGGQRSTIPKSTWKVPSHDARLYGTTMLRSLLGSTSFTYPKSPYAVMDTLRTVLADNREGLVLDFFAGSGTTLQAVAMLNRSDEGRRRVILVTNNELDEETAAALIADGHAPGDDQYEAHGICRAITAPRVRAALTGRGPDGRPLDGTYLDGSDLAGGFDENAVFFDLAYDDPDRIEIGQRLSDILPTLWLAAGAVGSPDDLAPGERWVMPAGTRFAVLLDEDAFRGFLALVKGCPRLTHAWLVTDSESAFARMRERLPKHLKTGMLYRDYLRNFRVNVEV